MFLVVLTVSLTACALHYRTATGKEKKTFVRKHRLGFGAVVCALQLAGLTASVLQFGCGPGVGIYLLVIMVAYSLLVVLVPLSK